MRRSLVILCALSLAGGCDKLKKKEVPADNGSAAPVSHATGHSVTKLNEDGTPDRPLPPVPHPENHPSMGGSGSSATEGHMLGGNGAAAYRGDDGRVHGPGGGVFMGRGIDCDAAHDHCLRDGVYFSVANIVSGKLYRATPSYEFEKKWWTWNGQAIDDPGKLYKTQIAGNAKLSSGTQVIFFSAETSDTKWADSEYRALTSSRWEAGVVDSQILRRRACRSRGSARRRSTRSG